MLTLVIDTSLHRTQAAFFDGATCLAHHIGSGGQGHAETLLPLIEAAKFEAKLDFKALKRVVVTTGPGIFTGIRIGISCARSFGLALKTPVVGVTTLNALACQAKADSDVMALIDAHKGEVYAQVFSTGGAPVSQPQLLKYETAQDGVTKTTCVIAYPASLKPVFDAPSVSIVEALDVSAILTASNLPSASPGPLPVYVRAPDALPSTKPALRRA